MPGEMDGYQLCEHLKQDAEFSDLAIVLLTARGQAADLEMGEAVGADRYLVKPFSPLQLVQTVRELTQCKQSRPVFLGCLAALALSDHSSSLTFGVVPQQNAIRTAQIWGHY